MKISTPLLPLAVTAALAAVAHAQDISLSFESSVVGWGTSANWAPTGPATDGAASAKINSVAGGWNLGTHAINLGGGSDLNGDSTADDVTIAAIAATGQGTVTFDIIIDHATSFPVAGGTWFSINLASNSNQVGADGGWTQFDNLVPEAGWHDDFSTGMVTKSLSYTFDQLNWDVTTGNWYQLNFGSNSPALNPVNFYVDNVVISAPVAVPEPSSSTVLAGLAVLAFTGSRFRRRR